MFNHDLLVLHTAKLSAMTEQGVLLTRCGISIIILLEKVIGVTYVTKL